MPVSDGRGFLQGRPQLKIALRALLLQYHVTNNSDEEADNRSAVLPRTVWRNSGGNAEGGRGIKRNEQMQQSTRQGIRNNTRICAEGGGGVAGGVGGEGGKRRERGERGGERREGEERRAILRLLLLRKGSGGALTSSFPTSRRCKDGC